MPNRIIEQHDSTVAAIVEVGTQIVVIVRGYMHQSEGDPGRDAGLAGKNIAYRRACLR